MHTELRAMPDGRFKTIMVEDEDDKMAKDKAEKEEAAAEDNELIVEAARQQIKAIDEEMAVLEEKREKYRKLIDKHVQGE